VKDVMSRKNQERRNAGAQEQHPAAEPASSNRGMWVIMVLCLFGAAVISFVVFRFVVPPVPRELVGDWQVTEGPLRGATLEIRAEGIAIATISRDRKKLITKSSVRVQDKQILLTTQDDKSGELETVTQSILKLTDNELVIQDEDQNVYRMRRVTKRN
jgi:uncharacterized protein (TIGR03066 family)